MYASTLRSRGNDQDFWIKLKRCDVIPYFMPYKDKTKQREANKLAVQRFRKRKLEEEKLHIQDSVWLMEVLNGTREFKPTKEMIERSMIKEVKT
jgi:hypothetical protein